LKTLMRNWGNSQSTMIFLASVQQEMDRNRIIIA
jgi:hypothetical protein